MLSAAIMLSCFLGIHITAQADDVASGTCGTNLNWTLDDGGTLTISGSGDRMSDYYDNSPAPWYDYREQITSVVIPSGVANIGSRAFLNCTNLVEVDWGTIDTIGDHAFMNCTSLKHAILPDSCTRIWTNVFEGCTALQSAYIGYVNSYAATVPQEFFKGCTSLAVLGLGTGISTLGTDCLNGCSALTAIISDNTSIQSTSYNVVGWSDRSGVCSDNTYSSSQLEWHFELGEARLYFTGSGDMTGYENGSQPWQHFIGAVNTVDFSTTDAKTSVSTTAFQGRTTIEEVDFTNIYAVGWGAFAECSALKYADFKTPLTQIWNYAFANCTSLDRITFEEGTDNLHIYAWAFNNCSGTTYWLNIPSNCTAIDDHAFWGTNFNYTHIYSNTVTIGEDAFGNGEGVYARFFGNDSVHTTIYDFVVSNRTNKQYNWWYYCNENHTYTTETVAPTCTEQGYDEYGCPYCDVDSLKSNFTDALGHDYEYKSTGNMVFKYDCRRCGEENIEASALDVQNLFESALSTTAAETKYNQPDYDGRCDINKVGGDGVINAKDLKILNDLLATPDLTDKKTTLDTSTTYQTIEGFGASAAWWSQDVGTWDNAEDIIKLLYSPTDGIGLNVYRYNLGAGSADQNDTALYVSGARTHCFMQSDGTYNWDNDPGAMNCLSIANSLNPNLKVTLFANSAPYFMTKSGKTYGALTQNITDNGDGTTTTTYTGTENLDSSQFSNFANYVATCAEHFIDEGYNVTAVSPINEPEWEWSGWMLGDGTQSCNQEGCHFDEGTARDFYNNAMVPALQNSSKLNGKVELEVWESGQMNHSWWWERFMNNCFSTEKQVTSSGSCGGTTTTGTEYANYNANIRAYVDTISTHSYWASTADREAAASLASTGQYFSEQNLKFKQTEYCQMNTDASTNVLGHIQAEGGNTNGMTIDYGLALADIIYQDMTIINATEWDWWTGCGRGIYPDSLIYINDTNHDNIQTSKRLWALGNYSKFIQEGAKRIAVTTGDSFGADLVTNTTYTWTSGENSGTDKNNYLEETAYLNPDGSVVVVYINNSDTNECTNFDSEYTSFESYVTSATKDLEKYQSGDPEGVVYIPAKSITTVVLKTATTHAQSTEGAYLFTYFTGNAQSEQRIRFAVSTDGYNFTPLNSNNEIITQTKGTLCCRDPYIFKGQDNYYYLIATDMDASENIWWGNSNTMVIWRSSDLVNWTDETIINMSEITGADDIQRCWAPQVFWDSNEQKYLVYFGLASWSITQNATVMYYCYTDDLLDQSHYSYPQLLYKPAADGKAAIDGDIFYDSKTGTYYLYYKDEDNATICYVTSDNLTGPYSDAANPTKLINTDIGLEGCNTHRITGTDTLVMLADAYGDGYFIMCQSTDYKNFALLDSNTYTINNCSPRHGSVIAISDAEYNALVSNFGY